MKKKGLLLRLYCVNFLFGAGLYNSIEVLYLESRNISTALISLFVLLIPLGAALFEIPTGIIGDVLGRKKVLRLTFLSFLISTVILLFSPNVFYIFIAYIFEALGYGFYSGNTESIIYEACAKKGKDVNKAFSNFYASLTLGFVVSGVLVNLLGFQKNASILTAALVVTVILRLIAVVLTFTVIEVTDEPAAKKPVGILKDTLTLFMKDKMSISISIYDALGRLQFYLPVIYQPLLIANGLSIQSIALVYSMSQLIQMLVQKVSPFLITKLGIPFLLKLIPIIQGISLLPILSGNTYLIIMGVALIFSCSSIKSQCTSLIRHSMVSNEIRATYMSIISLVTLLVNTILLSFIGLIMEGSVTIAVSILSLLLIVGSEFVVKNIIVKMKENKEQNMF